MAVADNPSLRFPIVFDFKDYLPGDIRYWVDTWEQINDGYVYLGMLRFVLGGDRAEQIYIKRSAGWQLLAGGSSDLTIGIVNSGEVASAKIEERNGVRYLDLTLPLGDAAVINSVKIQMIPYGSEPSGAVVDKQLNLNLPEAQQGPRGFPFKFDGKGSLNDLTAFDRPEYYENTSYLVVDPTDIINHGWLYLKNADGSWTRSVNMRGDRGPEGPLGPEGPRPWFAYAINQEGFGATYEQNPLTTYWAHQVSKERPALGTFTNWVKYVAKDGVDGNDTGNGGGGSGDVCTSEYQMFTYSGNSIFLLTEGEGEKIKRIEVLVEGQQRILFWADHVQDSNNPRMITLPNSGVNALFNGDKIHFSFDSCTDGSGTPSNPSGGSRHKIAGTNGVMPDQPNLFFSEDFILTNEVNTTKVALKSNLIVLDRPTNGLGGINAGEQWSGTIQEFVNKLFSGRQEFDITFGDIGGTVPENPILVKYIEDLLGGEPGRYKGRWEPKAYLEGDVVESTNGTGLWESISGINANGSHPAKNDGKWRQVQELGRRIYRGDYIPGTTILDIVHKGDVVEVQGAGLYRSIVDEGSILVNYAGNPVIDLENWIKIISANSKAEEFNYSQLEVVKNSNGLLIGNQYRLMDFESMGKKSYSNAIWKGPVEPITLTASSPNTFHPVATSSLYPLDEIYFDFDNKLCEDGTTPRKGKINRRIDPVRNIDISCDFRHVKEDRSKALGLFHHTASYDASTGFAATIIYGAVDAVPLHYKEWYIYFPSVAHGDAPNLTLTKGNVTLTRPIKKAGGIALGVNEIQTLLRANNVYHGLALIHYSKKYDCFYIRNNKAENDLVKDKYIALTPADFTIGNGTRIVVDASSTQEFNMLVNSNPNTRNIKIGPTSRPFPNIVWLSLNGIEESSIPENCFDITFANGLTHDMKLGSDCINLAVVGDLRWSRFGNELQNSLLASAGRIGLNTELNKDAASSGISFFVPQNRNYDFTAENLNNTTVRIIDGGSKSSGNVIGWMYNSVINWTNPMHNKILGLLSYKFWEPEASFSEVYYFKGIDNVPETFVDPKVDVVIMNIDTSSISVGHDIVNPLDQLMPFRKKLQFLGVSVTDDAVNGKTIIGVSPATVTKAWGLNKSFGGGTLIGAYSMLFLNNLGDFTSTGNMYGKAEFSEFANFYNSSNFKDFLPILYRPKADDYSDLFVDASWYVSQGGKLKASVGATNTTQGVILPLKVANIQYRMDVAQTLEGQDYFIKFIIEAPGGEILFNDASPSDGFSWGNNMPTLPVFDPDREEPLVVTWHFIGTEGGVLSFVSEEIEGDISLAVPIATTSALGVVKGGGNITISEEGELNYEAPDEERSLDFVYTSDATDEAIGVISSDTSGAYTAIDSANLLSYQLYKNGVQSNLPFNFVSGDEVRIVIVRQDTAKATYVRLI